MKQTYKATCSEHQNEYKAFLRGLRASSEDWEKNPQQPSLRIHFGNIDAEEKRQWKEPFTLCVMDKIIEKDIPYYHVGQYAGKVYDNNPLLSFSCFEKLKCAPYQDAHHTTPESQYIHSKSFQGGIVISEPITTFENTDWFKVGFEAGTALVLMLEEEEDNVKDRYEYHEGMPF